MYQVWCEYNYSYSSQQSCEVGVIIPSLQVIRLSFLYPHNKCLLSCYYVGPTLLGQPSEESDLKHLITVNDSTQQWKQLWWR